MNKIQRMQNDAAEFIKNRFNENVYEWMCENSFVDPHGFDGYLFKSELAAKRYVLGIGMQCAIDSCNGAVSGSDWINILMGCGLSKRVATKVIEKEDWERVVKTMLNQYGAAWFLSSYSGQIHDLDCGMLLYY